MTVISCRETLFSTMILNPNFKNFLDVNEKDLRRLQLRSLFSSTKIARKHGTIQECLSIVSYLTRVTQSCEDVGLQIRASVEYETASVLWDQNERESSIQMLRELEPRVNDSSSEFPLNKSTLLAKLVSFPADSQRVRCYSTWA